MSKTQSPTRRWRPLLRAAASYLVLLVGIGATFGVAYFGLRVMVLSRHSMELDAEWNRSYKDAVLHLQTYALTGEEVEWQDYERALAYPVAARAGIRASVESPGDGDRMRAALEGNVPSEDVDYWAGISDRFGDTEWYQRIARARAEKDAILAGVEEEAIRLRAAVAGEGPSSPAVLGVALTLRTLDERMDAVERPFWTAVIRVVQVGENVAAGSLALTALVVALGGGLVIAVVAARSRRYDRRLREDEARFREITEAVTGAVWTMDANRRRFLYISPGYERIWRRPAADLVGNPESWLDTIHPDDRAKTLAAWNRKDSDERMIEFRILRPNGEVRYIRNRSIPIREENGETVRWVGFAEDMTKDHELEQEIVRSQQLRSVGRLAGGVAHEFNNLLTVAQGHLQLLLADHHDDPATVADVTEALNATRRAGDLTRDLLSFAGRQILQLRAVDLAEFVESSRPMVTSVLPVGVDLETSFRAQLFVRADPAYLRELLLSLVQFCGERMGAGGSLSVRVQCATTTEPLRVEGGRLPAGAWGVLIVEDSGGAMPSDLQQRLFEPYGAAESVAFPSRLGLAAAYGIAEQSGGGIRVNAGEMGGVRFEAYFAIAEPSSR